MPITFALVITIILACPSLIGHVSFPRVNKCLSQRGRKQGTPETTYPRQISSLSRFLFTCKRKHTTTGMYNESESRTVWIDDIMTTSNVICGSFLSHFQTPIVYPSITRITNITVIKKMLRPFYSSQYAYKPPRNWHWSVK